MIPYIREQFLVHLAHNAKKVTHKRGHSLKKAMPRNVTKKNALRIARYRNKGRKKTLVRELKQTVEETTKENESLERELQLLKDQVSYYEKQYGKHKKEIHKSHRSRLQEIVSLQREVLANQQEAKQLYKAKKISQEEFEELSRQCDINQNALRKKKQKILLG